MVAYDSIYGAPAAAKRSRAVSKLSGLLGQKTANASADTGVTAPPVDYALTPDSNGKITLAGKKVPLVLAVLGVAAAGALLLNRRTRGPMLAAATTAWGMFGNSALLSKFGKKA